MVEDKFSALKGAAEEGEGTGLVTLSSGVVFKVLPVSPLLLTRLAVRFEEPKVPVVHDESYGKEMANPDDPDYKAAMRNHETKVTQLMVDGFVMYGTKVESVPKGFPKHTDDEWIGMLHAVGEETQPDDEYWRYMVWVETQAIKNADDMKKLVEEVGRLSGVAEKDADAAAETFRGDEGEGKDTKRKA